MVINVRARSAGSMAHLGLTNWLMAIMPRRQEQGQEGEEGNGVAPLNLILQSGMFPLKRFCHIVMQLSTSNGCRATNVKL